MPECTPAPKQGKPKAKPHRGRARPEEPLAVVCQAAIEGVCLTWSTERHHLLRRSQGGTDEQENTIDICGDGGCHGFIHRNVAWAYEHGYLMRGVK